MRRWRGLKALVHDAIDHTTRLVEEGHASVARTTVRVADLLPPLAAPVRVVDAVRRVTTAGILGTVRAANRAVEHVTDAGLDAVERALVDDPAPGAAVSHAAAPSPVAMRSDALGAPVWLGDAALGAVNAAVGDYLHRGGNGLALEMQLRAGDRYLPAEPSTGDVRAALPHATPRLAVFVHGLGTTEWSWCLNAAQYHGDAGTHFGTLLARDLGYTPVFVRYNSGRHISENGRLLATQLERLVEAYPGALGEVLLVGHSMGGLVARSACHYARAEERRWLARVRRVVCLGSPHEGAPLEKLSNVAAAVLARIDAPGTRIPALVLNGRSAGIKDLRYGNLVDEDWLGRDPDALLEDGRREVPLLDDVAYYFVSATLTRDPAHPVGQLLGDLLVRVPSASGPRLARGAFAIETQCFGGVLHHEIQNHPDVYALLRRLCADEPLGL